MPRHPIEDFVSQPSFADFRIPELPTTFKPEVWRQWKVDFERVLVERLRALQAAAVVTTETPAPSTPTSADLTSLTNQLVALNLSVQEMIDSLEAHIAATVVHGTESDVVGETDEQALEAKTIGFSVARDAMFRHSISRNNVSSSETFTIPDNNNVIVAGPMTVDGTMMINGYFASV